MNPMEKEDEYSNNGHLRVTCCDCGKESDFYTEDPYVAIHCIQCEEKAYVVPDGTPRLQASKHPAS